MEHPPNAEHRLEKDTGRVESFSDGVFSVAMTLLVLELKVPQLPRSATPATLWAELAHQWPGYFAFVTSFATIFIMWVYHHGIFRLVRRTNGNLLFANGFLLMLVTSVPFSTALVAAFLRTPAASAVCELYAGVFVLIAIAHGLLLMSARRDGHLMDARAAQEIDRRIRDCFRVGFPLYLLAAVVASFSVWLSLGICSVLWIYWTAMSVDRGTGFSQ